MCFKQCLANRHCLCGVAGVERCRKSNFVSDMLLTWGIELATTCVPGGLLLCVCVCVLTAGQK